MRKPAYAIYVLFVCSFLLFFTELSARFIWNKKYADWLNTSVNPFGYIDRSLLLERYRPGYSVTVGELLQILMSTGRLLGYEQILSTIKDQRLAKNQIAFQINALSLKGPEASIKPTKGIARVLTIGDSSTFGPYIDTLSYPRQLEKLLNSWRPGRFEVINAGHLGYNVQQVLARIDEWLLLEPTVVTIYVGWNRTIQRADPKRWELLYEKSALYRLFYHAVINTTDSKGLKNLFTSQYDMNDPIVSKLKREQFRVDLEKLEQIITKIQSKSAETRIIIVALAGLYDVNTLPSSTEIAMGYATSFTPNLAAWPILSEQYNKRLKALAAKRNLAVSDLETYARTNFVPRSKYFVDTVHPSVLGNLRIAEFLKRSIEIELTKSAPGLLATKTGGR